MFARIVLILCICYRVSFDIRAQDIAQISCSPKAEAMTNRVPVFTSPGSAFVVEYLSCGQQVTLLGNERGFAKVQYGEHVGYVVSQYVVLRPATSASGSNPDKSDTELKPSEAQEHQNVTSPSEEISTIGRAVSPAKPAATSTVDLPRPSSKVDLDAAIAYGSQFKSRKQFLEKGLKDSKVQLASAWAKDGISKYVTFFTDFEAVASAAANAQQEMRTFTSADASKLPLSGLVYAHVEIHGRGMIPTRKVASRYVKNSAHLVVQFGDKVVQPLSKEMLEVRDASFVAPVALFTYWDTGNVSLLTGGTLGYEGEKVEMEFVFSLTPEQMTQKGTVILIDGDGNRHKEEADLSKIIKKL